MTAYHTKKWKEVLKFFKTIGCEESRHHKVCITVSSPVADDHLTLLEDHEDCIECGKEWKNATDYYVLGLKPQNIFLSKDSIKMHTAHWRERDEWFKKSQLAVPRKELWHGDRFRELSYFWDEDSEFLLPSKCDQCQNIISTEMVNNGIDIGNDITQVICGYCSQTAQVECRFTSGNPLNQCFIFHEDRFNAFLKRTHSVAAISFSSGCSGKADRCNTYKVYSFAPTCKLPKGLVHKFDAFLEPLVSEVTDLYLDGFEIDLKDSFDISGHHILAGHHKVRCLLLLGTADMKAHAEMVLHPSG